MRLGLTSATPVALPATSVALGLLIVERPTLAVVAASAVPIAAIASLRGSAFYWDLLTLCLGGTLILGYGFANVGLSGGVPLPLVDLLLAVLIVRIIAGLSPRVWSRPFFVLLLMYITWATIRLAADLPRWGSSAVRDYTLPLEMVFLPVGYWAFIRYRLARWIRTLRWIFVGCAVYLALFPLRSQLQDFGPTVGLQHSVPLLGSYAGAATAGAAAFLFFVILRPFGSLSYGLGLTSLAFLILFESRGLYIALPLALLLTWFLAQAGVRVRGRLVGSVVLGVAATVLVLSLAPAGRIGPASASFISRQIDTLFGKAGPGAGSLQTRHQFNAVVFQTLNENPIRWAVGAGLGPDLAGSFRARQDALVRKPHDDYLEQLGRLGLIGLTLFVGILIVSLHSVVRGARRLSGEEARFAWWVFGVSIVFLVIAATQPLLAFPYGTVPLFTLMGAALALTEAPSRRLTTATQPGGDTR